MLEAKVPTKVQIFIIFLTIRGIIGAKVLIKVWTFIIFLYDNHETKVMSVNGNIYRPNRQIFTF